VAPVLIDQALPTCRRQRMVEKEHYTFGDTDLAAERLRLLAQVFEPSSARLLSSLGPNEGAAALDLGCGPGHTTRLLAEHTSASRVYGLDQSTRLLATAAREHTSPRLSFVECDVTAPPFPVPAAVLVYARFLLTHLRNPAQVLQTWASVALPGARLVLEETAFMTAEQPAFARYYGLVERMQAHYGQRMYIGRDLGALALAAAPAWTVERAEVRVSPLPARDMARLHLLNLRTWSQDPFAQANYDPSELDELEASLEQIASGVLEAQPVSLGMGQVVLTRS
jgi:trans-aconitate 2-methyltransferase